MMKPPPPPRNADNDPRDLQQYSQWLNVLQDAGGATGRESEVDLRPPQLSTSRRRDSAEDADGKKNLLLPKSLPVPVAQDSEVDLIKPPSRKESSVDPKRPKKKSFIPIDVFDPARQGPDKNRSCTDIFCVVLFAAFMICFIIVAVIAFTYGDPRLLLYPVDTAGNMCGYGKSEHKEYLLFFDFIVCGRIGPGIFVKGCPTPQVCVSKCPDKNYIWIEDYNPMADGEGNKDSLICKDGVNKKMKTLSQLVEDKDCAQYYFKSYSLMKRCLPLWALADVGNDVVKISGKLLQDSSNSNVTGNDVHVANQVFQAFLQAESFVSIVIHDLSEAWLSIVLLTFLCMFICLVWIYLMRFSAGLMVGLSILIFLGLFALGAYVCYQQYDFYKHSDQSFEVGETFNVSLSKAKFYLVLGIIISVFLAIIVIILFLLCRKIRTAVCLIKECSRAITKMKFTLLWPVVPFALHLFVVVLWVCIAVYLSTISRNNQIRDSGSINKWSNETVRQLKAEASELFEEAPCEYKRENGLPNNTLLDDFDNELCGFVKHGRIGRLTVFLQLFNLFMGFWLINFVVGLGEMTLAGAFGSYYWAFDKEKDMPPFPLLQSLFRCLRYHLGTLAFGSLLLALFSFARILIEYLQGKLKGSTQYITVFILKCLSCCFYCLEKFMKFLSKRAYIMTAIMGKNFWYSCKSAFNLILRNSVNVLVVDTVSDFVLFISRLAVMGAMGACSFYFYTGRFQFLAQYRPDIQFESIPITMVLLASYLISSVFFDVYAMAVDTIFLCFLQDLELHDGSKEKPYFMTKGLMKMLSLKNTESRTAKTERQLTPQQSQGPEEPGKK